MNYYDKIEDLPLYNWIKITNGELNYCRLDLSIGNNDDDLKYFDLISDDNYKYFGLGSEYLNLLDIQLQLSEIRLDFVITGDNFLKNKISMLETEIEDIINKDLGNDNSIDETIIYLSKWMGSRINPRETTVKEFRTMISLLKKESELRNKK